MKIIVTFGFICFISIKMYATTSCSDTLPKEKPYKVSRQQFLEEYGKGDTAKAIINIKCVPLFT